MKKHFLGKPHREMEYWYPQQLVGEVEHFLKKSQVGHGNKEFTASLIKFIEKLNDKSKEESRHKYSLSCPKAKDKENTCLKRSQKMHTLDYSTKKNTCNLASLRDEHINLRTNTNSFWRATESRITQGVSNVCLAAIKSHCWDIVNEFRSVVFSLLLEKEIKRKKIKKLIDSMSSSLMESFDNGSSHMR
jgi:hypothetical protein